MRHAVVLGASGAVGSALVRELLASAEWASVTIFVRRPARALTELRGAAKLTERLMDGGHLESQVAGELALRRDAQQGATTAFCTLGVGQPSRVTREELRRVDVGIAGAFARGCRSGNVSHFSLLTAVGANPRSRIHYLRVKGEIEGLVASLAFARASFLRPSMIMTPAIRFGLRDRLAHALVPVVSPLLPSRYHQVSVDDLARAMRLNAEREGAGVEALEWGGFSALLGEPGARDG